MDVIKPLIEGNKVVVFSKTYCPYCTKAKLALEGARALRVGELAGQAPLTTNTRNRVLSTQGVGLTKGSYALLELDNHPRADEVRMCPSLCPVRRSRSSGAQTGL